MEKQSPDDWQTRIELRKAHRSSTIKLSDPESVSAFADKFIVQPRHTANYLQHLQVLEFKKKKRSEERAQKARGKEYHDYNWHELYMSRPVGEGVRGVRTNDPPPPQTQNLDKMK